MTFIVTYFNPDTRKQESTIVHASSYPTAKQYCEFFLDREWVGSKLLPPMDQKEAA